MKKKIFWILLVLLILIFCISTFFVLREVLSRKHTQDLYEQIAQQKEIHASEQTEAPREPETTENAEQTKPAEQLVQKPAILPEYRALAKQNPDMVGWLCIEDTTIDLPVMYSPDRPDYYLNHDFTGETNRYGCLYIQEDCDLQRPSDNLIIHGHDMHRDGLMFGNLIFYLEKDFWEAHPRFRFDTLWEHGLYEIIAVARTAVDEFPYYHFIDAAGEEEFNAYVEKCKSISLYDTGKTAEYGDQLITLSTCIYHKQGGRLIVVAKKVK